MSYQKQDLNGAYYGPPIPPPQSYNRPSRHGSRGCGCCLLNCIGDCGCCLLSCVFKLICSILVIIGLIILVIWLIVRPHEVKFHATDASLTTFNLTTLNGDTNHMSYNLAVNFSVRNPNKHIGVYYDQIEANAIYGGQRLSTVHAQSFYQGTKNTTDFGPVVFKGNNQVVMLGGVERAEYEKQTSDGEYEIVVKMYLRVRFKLGLFKTATFKPKVKCDLKVPVDGGKSGQKFETTRCHYDF